jgi:hypothetical protein
MYGPRCREPVQHQALQNLDCEAMRQHDRLGASERRPGEHLERPVLLGAPPALSWSHHHCTLDQVLPRAGCSRQLGRASAPMIPHVHPRPEHGHWHVIRPRCRADDRLVGAWEARGRRVTVEVTWMPLRRVTEPGPRPGTKAAGPRRPLYFASLPNTRPVDRFMRCVRVQARHFTASKASAGGASSANQPCTFSRVAGHRYIKVAMLDRNRSAIRPFDPNQ